MLRAIYLLFAIFMGIATHWRFDKSDYFMAALDLAACLVWCWLATTQKK